MSALTQAGVGLLITAAGAWAVPAAGMRMLVPALDGSERQAANYRGRVVFLGLGVVWVFWAIGLAIANAVAYLAGVATLGASLTTQIALVAAAFVFGIIDDVFGTSVDKGFRGHLHALRHGRLTTGGLKLLGIGFASLWAAASLVIEDASHRDWSSAGMLVGLGAGTVLIAGSSNLLNLLDLRPGRALKGYLALSAASLLAGAFAIGSGSVGVGALTLVTIAVQLAGPALAVWGYDIGERGMLGDAGANPAGALAGFALMRVLPLWLVVLAAGVVVMLNLASERFSFSRVIAGNRVLSWFDALGRVEDRADAGTPGSADPRAQRDVTAGSDPQRDSDDG